MNKLRIALAAMALLLVASSAFAFEKGQTLLGLEVGSGSSSWLSPTGTAGYVTTAPALPTLRAGAELWFFTKESYAVTISGGIDHFSETDKPGTAALPGAEDQKSTISGYHARIGGDHFYALGDRAQGKRRYSAGLESRRVQDLLGPCDAHLG